MIVFLPRIEVFLKKLGRSIHIGGLIAVVGTGIDQMVVITDEILHERRILSPTVYLKRLALILMIMVIAGQL